METSHSIIQAVKEGSLVRVKQLVGEGEDLDGVDCEGNTALHHAVLGEHYNIAIILLNNGARLDILNSAGLDCLQLAQASPARTVFSIAIQLTRRNRLEQEKLEQKQELLRQQQDQAESGGESEDGGDSEDSDGEVPLHLPRILQAAQLNLSSAKNLVTNLESQVCSARSLVNQLELEVSRLKVDVERQNKRKHRNTSEDKTRRKVKLSSLDHCSICLEVPRPLLKVFQCPEGHSWCEDCGDRYEMIACPECRISLEGLTIRNRTLERLIQLHHGVGN